MSEEWTGATYDSERVVVHELVDPGARACILRRLPHVNERRMNMTLSVVFCLKEKSDDGERVFDIERREKLTKESNSSHWDSAGDRLHENPLNALLKAADNPKPASGIHVLRRNNAKNEGAGEAGGGCCPCRRDVGARGEASGKKKRIRNSLNICGATPLVSQNHVLTTLRAGSSRLKYCTTNLHTSLSLSTAFSPPFSPPLSAQRGG